MVNNAGNNVVSLDDFRKNAVNNDVGVSVSSFSDIEKQQVLELAAQIEEGVVSKEYFVEGCNIFQAVKLMPEQNGHRVIMMLSKKRDTNMEPYEYSLTISSRDWGCNQHQTINFSDIISKVKAFIDNPESFNMRKASGYGAHHP